ncbi:MAG: YgfZ/GcvT domain-containing protein [Stenotrophobium sp.]
MNPMQKTAIPPLGQLAYLHVSGADAEAFLQGQLSSDIRLLTAERAQISSFNSPKGRMLAVLHLFRHGDGVVMELERSLLEPVLKRLRMFVLRSKVMIENISDTLPALGIAGEAAADTLRSLGLSAPEKALDSRLCGNDGGVVIRRFGETPRYSVHAAASTLAALQAQLLRCAEPADTNAWRRLDILAGVPAVHPQTVDHFVAQMANLDLLGGISFDKGCYTGQEIVARLHYLGQLKRRMVVCRSAARDIPPGTAVHDAGVAQAVGEVVQSAAEGEGSVLSVVLQLGHASSTQLCLGDTQNSPLTKPVGVPAD